MLEYRWVIDDVNESWPVPTNYRTGVLREMTERAQDVQTAYRRHIRRVTRVTVGTAQGCKRSASARLRRNQMTIGETH